MKWRQATIIIAVCAALTQVLPYLAEQYDLEQWSRSQRGEAETAGYWMAVGEVCGWQPSEYLLEFDARTKGSDADLNADGFQMGLNRVRGQNEAETGEKCTAELEGLEARYLVYFRG